MPNPFNPKHPVDPEFFVNRKEIIDAFIRSFKRSAETRPPKPDNIAILGDWGLGKTSVLRKLESVVLKELKDLRVFSAFIELTPETSMNFKNFMIRTRDEIERSFKVVELPLLVKLKKEIIPSWRIRTIDFGITIERKELEKQALSPVTIFEDALRNLWDSLQTLKFDIVLLMLDDLHYLAEYSPNALYDIRGIFQKLAIDGCNYYLAISAKESLFFKAKEFAEPFTRFFDRFKLDLFDLADTRRAILVPLRISNTPVTISEDVIERIHNLTQGHPYFIHFVMHDLVDLKEKGTIDMRFFETNYPKIATHLSREKFQDDLYSASERDRKVLFEMAKLEDLEVAPSNIKTIGARSALKGLVDKKGLVKKSARGRYSLYHPLFKEYLRSIEKNKI